MAAATALLSLSITHLKHKTVSPSRCSQGLPVGFHFPMGGVSVNSIAQVPANAACSEQLVAVTGVEPHDGTGPRLMFFWVIAGRRRSLQQDLGCC
jgi:hypothetical protein